MIKPHINMAEGRTDSADHKGAAVHSVSTRSSKASSCHSGSSIAVFKARAKTEAVQAAYAKRELELKVEQACLQSTLEALQEEKEKDAALAEARILEEALLETKHSATSRVSVPVPIEDRQSRTVVLRLVVLHCPLVEEMKCNHHFKLLTSLV